MRVIEWWFAWTGLEIEESFEVEKDIFSMSLEELSETRKIHNVFREFNLLIGKCDEMELFIKSFKDDEVKLTLVELAEIHKPCSKVLAEIREEIISRVEQIMSNVPQITTIQ